MTTENNGLTPHVLVVDDEKNICDAIAIALSTESIHLSMAPNTQTALQILKEKTVDVMLVDIRLGEESGLQFYRRLIGENMNIPTIFISGEASLSEAAQAIKLGAYDFLEKPFSSEKISVLVQRCLEYTRIQKRLDSLEQNKSQTVFIGESTQIKQLLFEIERVAKTNASVLIGGESGTGKELVANFLHEQSLRQNGPFLKVNCSAIPENLIESELFGYEKGAFSGALQNKKGYFELAHQGTLFLDEIADLSASAQAKLLRVLQSGEVQKVGAERVFRVDVRVVAGTHKDLKQAVQNGLFREDLFYRLNVIPFKIPSLRERIEDIPLLIEYFKKITCQKNNIKEKKIEFSVIQQLQHYHWPGNVRELQNILERMIILGGPIITEEDLPEELSVTNDLQEDKQSETISSLKDFRDRLERNYIIQVLKHHNGNITQSAEQLAVGRTYLHRRLRVLNIAKKDYV